MVLSLIGTVGDRVQLGQPGTAATNTPIVPASADYDDREIAGMMIDRGNQVLGENLSQCRFVHHKPPHVARTRTWAAAVGSQRLTA
jgi:hypothetical protein